MFGNSDPLEISPDEFEQQVCSWLRTAAKQSGKFSVKRLQLLEGDGGEYEIDVLAKWVILGGAEVTVLVECKRYSDPVKRDIIMILESKIRDSNAHKGIVFSTSGFQRGAIKYAQKRGIATVEVKDGKTRYITASGDKRPVELPPWLKLPRFIGWFMTINDKGNETGSVIDDDSSDSLENWISLRPAKRQKVDPDKH